MQYQKILSTDELEVKKRTAVLNGAKHVCIQTAPHPQAIEGNKLSNIGVYLNIDGEEIRMGITEIWEMVNVKIGNIVLMLPQAKNGDGSPKKDEKGNPIYEKNYPGALVYIDYEY